MSSELQEELKAFERDLASIVARFLRLYERVEAQVRGGPTPPEAPAAPKPLLLRSPSEAPHLPGYH